MPFSDTKIEQLFYSMLRLYPSYTCAELWVKAENFMLLRSIIVQWANYIKQGVADSHQPGIACVVTQSAADKLCAEIEDDMMHEVNTRKSLDNNAGPGFIEMSPGAKRQFASEVISATLSYKQVKSETKQRLLMGKQIPLSHIPSIDNNPNMLVADYTKKEAEDFAAYMVID